MSGALSQDQAASFLRPLEHNGFEQYHTDLLAGIRRCEISSAAQYLGVRQDIGGGKGKGIVADEDIDQDSFLFREPPLVRQLH